MLQKENTNAHEKSSSKSHFFGSAELQYLFYRKTVHPYRSNTQRIRFNYRKIKVEHGVRQTSGVSKIEQEFETA